VNWLGVACLPLLLLLAMVCALGVSLWMSALMVKYRDVQHLLPFVVQMWMYLTPVAYSTSLVPPGLGFLYSVNPMVGVVNGFRWALLGRTAPHWPAICSSAILSLVLLVTGALYFRRAERDMVDLI
jgi:lipopolysaccharide transport system permease protein